MKRSFSDIKALFINCSIKKDSRQSHTQRLINRVAGIMSEEGVQVEKLYALNYDIAFGMIKDGTKEQPKQKDDWPSIERKILDSDILVLATPIWLGVKSSVASLVIERMYAYSADRNDKGQYVYYGRIGGCIVTGNEDGIKHCSMDLLYALQHIGYTIPPQADCGWIGEAGPGPSYGDTVWDGKPIKGSPVGYDNDFTNRNATIMAWNLMHTARMLKDNKGLPAEGNVADKWSSFTNARDQDPEA